MENKISEWKTKIEELKKECKTVGVGLTCYWDNSDKFPRVSFEKLYRNAKSLNYELQGKTYDFDSWYRFNSSVDTFNRLIKYDRPKIKAIRENLYWDSDGFWFFFAKELIEESIGILSKKMKKGEK